MFLNVGTHIVQIHTPQPAVGNSNVGGHTKRRRGTRRAKKKTCGTKIQVASLATGAFFFIFPYLLLNNLYIRVHKKQKYMFVCVCEYEKGGVLFIYSTTDEIKQRRIPRYDNRYDNRHLPIFTKLVLENVAYNLVVDSVCHR